MRAKLPVVSIGTQSFEKLREMGSFYVDKTSFIREWWENQDEVTLITRPRRFGKTLNLSMTECFFSNKYAGRSYLFEGLSIWEEEEYQKLQGTLPVISLSFAGVKSGKLQGAKDGIVNAIANAYEAHSYLKNSDILNEDEKRNFDRFGNYCINPSPNRNLEDATVCAGLQTLSKYLEKCYGRKVMILLDEYDTPLQEAYVSGYWGEMVEFIRELFNMTFKTNPFLGRALLTGITRVSKESIFSDLNHLEVVTTTSEKYGTSFGFTEAEVFQSLDERGLSSEKDMVKYWYDGFIFGSARDIYNPWSITKYLDSERYGTYWADTSSNRLVSELIRKGTPELKMQMEGLLEGDCVEVVLEEQVVFDQLYKKKGAIWSLLVASGYLKPVRSQFSPTEGEARYQLKITNFETTRMFRGLISDWFSEDFTPYSDFRKALLLGDLYYMNRYMNEVSKEMFSSFDVGNRPSDAAQPERFYHGFVLGLIVDLADRYRIRSNRESGFGRYDVLMEPRDQKDDGIILEFKVRNPDREKSLEETVGRALEQIREKEYHTELISRGIPRERIRAYGIAFEGKKVLIGQAPKEEKRIY